MKKLIVASIVALFVLSGFSMAYAENENKKCQNVVGVWVDCSSITDNSVDRSITNTNSATGGAGGDGGNATVNNSGNSSNKNYNTNINSNKNTNLNTNKQAQGQLQGQAQGQVATAGAAAINAGNKQTTEVVIQDNSTKVQNIVDFNHITPDIGRTSAEHKSVRDTMTVKVMSDIDSMLSSITLEMARKLGEDTSDYKMFKELLWENDFRTSMLRKGTKGIFMGSIIFTPTGSKVTLGGLSGRAYEAAMDAGATHWDLQSTKGQYTSGSKAGFDLGSAASVVAKSNGSAVIAPGATLGYSHAWSENEYRAGVVIDLYFDSTMKVTPAVKGVEYDREGR